MKDKLTIGGQAVIEGVMMRSPHYYSVAVRKPNGKIKTKVEKLNPLSKRYKLFKKPFFRGMASLGEMLYLGLKTLTYSANESADEDEKISTTELVLTLLFSMVMTVLIFIVVPFYLSKLVTEQHIWFNLIDGVLRGAIFILYLLIIARMDDIKTLFQYHGAEHMSVYCYENDKKLTVKNVRKYSTLHARCGTTFLIIVLMISIVVFSLIISESWWVKFVSRIVLIPVVAGTSYEILKFGARHTDSWIYSIFTKPGLWIQNITTKKPTDKQIQVAIKALQAVLKAER